MAGYVFDTEPLVSFLYREPGHEAVARRLASVESGDADGRIADVTAAELFSLVARLEGHVDEPTQHSLRLADRDVRSLERAGVGITRVDWDLAGEVKANGGISLGGSYAVALAYHRGDTLVVGGDADFDDLPVEVTVERVGARR